MSDNLRSRLLLAVANADGQSWDSLDDAPSRGEFMGYPAIVQAAMECIGDDLKDMAMRRFDERGPYDQRGAAFWDAGCYLIEHP